MKRSALNTDIFREFFRSKSRILSIVAMVGLGSLVLLGLSITGPTMRESMNKLLTEYNMPDLVIQSTYGLDYEDRATIERIKGVKILNYGYQYDVLTSKDDRLIRLESLKGDLPGYKIMEGRLPERIGEIALDDTLYESDYELGDKVTFLKGNREPIEGELVTNEFIVVGKVQSPEYMIVDFKGRSSLGKGELDGFGVVTEDNFDLDVYAIARLKFEDTSSLKFSDSLYAKVMDDHKSDMENILTDRPELRLAKIRSDANKDITEAEDKIKDAKTKLSDAEKELVDARKKLDDGIVEYYDGKEEFRIEIQKAETKLADASKKLSDARSELDTGWIDYRSGLSTFEREIRDAEIKLSDAKIKLNDAKVKLSDGQAKYDQGLKEYNDEIGSAEKKLKDAKDKLDKAKVELSDGWAEYEKGKAKYDQEIAKAKSQLTKGEAELVDGKKKLDEGIAKLESEKARLEAGKAKYEKGKAELEAKRPELEAGKAQLNEGQALIDDGYAQVNAQEADLSAKLTSAKSKRAELAATADGIKSMIPKLEMQIAGIMANPEMTDEQKAAAIIPIEAQIAAMNENLIEIEKGITAIDGSIPMMEGGLVKIAEQRAYLDEEQRKLDREKAKFNVGYSAFLAGEAELNAAKSQLDDGQRQLEAGEAQLNQAKSDYYAGLAELKAGWEKLNREQQKGQEKLRDALQKLRDGQAEYDDGLIEYQKGESEFLEKKADAQKKLSDAKKKLDDGRSEYENGLAEYNDGLNKLNKEKANGQKKLDDALIKLNDGESEYKKGYNEWIDGKNTLEKERADGENKLTDAYNDILEGEEKYRDGLSEFADKKSDADVDISDGESEITDAKKELAKLKIPKYFVSDINDNYGVHTYLSNSKRMDLLSMIFPIFFYLIAMLVTVTSVTRMVDEQRTQIGTLKSLGYPGKEAAKKYLIYAAVPSIVGSIAGILIGHTLLSDIIYNAYSTGFLVGKQVLRPYPLVIIITLVVSIAASIVAAAISSGSTLKHNAATLLRPKAPKKGTRIFLERISPVWNRLSFMHKVTARNIFRYKARMLMTIIGVAGCTALLFMGFGIQDSITQIGPLQFGQIVHYNLISIFDPESETDALKEYNSYLDGNEKITSRQTLRYEMGQINFKDKPNQEVQVITIPSGGDLSELITLRSRTSKEDIDLNSAGVVISEKLAQVLKVRVGDEFQFEDDDKNVRSAVVGGITENYVNHYIYLTQDIYEEQLSKPLELNADLLKLTDNSENSIDDTISDLMLEKPVQSIINTGRVSYQVTELMKSLKLVIVVLIAVSSTLAIVVLYNLTNINVSERIRELSTIKVLGFYPLEVTEYVYRETMVLSIMGILFGFAVGKLLHWFIITIIVPEHVMMSPRILWTNFALSSAITMALSLLVMVLMHLKLKKVDMVEALKAIE